MSADFERQDYGDAAKRQAQYNAALIGGGKGVAYGLGAALPTAYVLNRSWAPFRTLTPSLKAFFITSATFATGIIAADKAGQRFEVEHYSDAGAQQQRKYQTMEQKEWDALSTRDKVLTWAKENKFGVVAGSWVTSLGLTFAYIQTQPLSFAQKLVQARVWAQGLTVASLVGMAAITQIPSAGDKIIQQHNDAAEHSWRDFVGDTESDEDAAKRQQRKQKAQKPSA